MKRLTFTLMVALIAFSAMAQTPDLMSYQAVVRDASNMLVTNQNVGIQASILESSASGTAVYVETHNITTNANGLATLQIGGGVVVSGLFEDIEWSGDDHFLKVQTDPMGGTNYTITGTSQLLSVPYALSARTVEELPRPVYTSFGSLNNTSYTLTTTMTGVGVAFSLTKESDNTVLEITMNSRINSGVFAGASGIRLQLRVDGVVGDFATDGSIRASDTQEFISMFSVFENLPAGSYTVQVYAQTNSGTSTGFSFDPGGWGGRIIVKETH